MTSSIPPSAGKSMQLVDCEPRLEGGTGAGEAHTVVDGDVGVPHATECSREWLGAAETGRNLRKRGVDEADRGAECSGKGANKALAGEQELGAKTCSPLHEARNMYCIEEDFFELVGRTQRQGQEIVSAAPRSHWLLLHRFFRSMHSHRPTGAQELVDELHGRGARILAEHMARLTKGDGATVSAGGVVGPSISLKEAYDSLRDVDSRGQWELQSLGGRC